MNVIVQYSVISLIYKEVSVQHLLTSMGNRLKMFRSEWKSNINERYAAVSEFSLTISIGKLKMGTIK